MFVGIFGNITVSTAEKRTDRAECECLLTNPTNRSLLTAGNGNSLFYSFPAMVARAMVCAVEDATISDLICVQIDHRFAIVTGIG